MPGPSLTSPKSGYGAVPTPAGLAETSMDDGPSAPGGLRLLLALLRPRRRALVAAAGWSLVEALPTLSSGLILAAATDRGFLTGRPGVGLAWLGVLVVAMFVEAVATRMMFPHLATVAESLRDDLVRAVVTATVTRAAGGADPPDTAAVTRLTDQVETLRNLVSALLRSARELGISLIAALAGLLLLSPLAAAIVAGPVFIALVVFVRLLRVLLARQRALILANETLTVQATPIVAGLRDIAACGAREQAYATVHTAVTAQAAATRALAWAGEGRRLVITIGTHLPLLGLLIFARPLIQNGHLSAGEVIGAVTYTATGLGPALRTLVGTVGTWGVTLVITLGRLAETITPPSTTASGSTAVAPASLPGGASATSPETAAVGHQLETQRLSFAYAPQATPVVHELDLVIPEGEHLAVIGPSGIGKSTLAMLLTGLRRPGSGRVRLGGLPLEATPEHHLRSVMALVPQEAYVFAGTVGENLAYLHPAGTHAPESRLQEAADAVGARDLVERLGGLDATIEEPSALSAGERQLIALARVYASPARVVILDEATCHLDPAAELRAETAFAARAGTLIVIAHRISSAIRAQRVLLMDGATALTGTHSQLLTRSALYADLVGHWRYDAPSGNTASPAR